MPQSKQKPKNQIAIINDLHYGTRNDLQAMFEHQNKFNKVFFKTLKDRNIKTVIVAGDLWERRKYINFVSLNKARKIFLEPLRNFVERDGGEVHFIPGNHDIRYKDTLSVNSLTETLLGYPFHIHLKPVELSINNREILLIPWICEENYRECMDAISNSKALVCIGHFEINGFEMHRGNFAYSGMDANDFSKFDFVGSGHYHHRSVHGNIHYLGATYQFTWADYNDPRGFTILDLDNLKPEYIDNKYEIFKVYLYNDEVNKEKIQDDIDNNTFKEYRNCYVRINIQKRVNPYMFDLLLNKIQKAGPIKISIVDEFNQTLGEIESEMMNEVEDTPTILSKYIDGLDLGDRSFNMKKLMNDLYQEALTLETVE